MSTPGKKLKEWLEAQASRFEGQLLWDEPLARHTYYRIGGPARVVAVPRSRQDLELLQQALQATQAPFFVLGLGSNVLASDQGFEGLVLKSQKLDLGIELLSEALIRTGASVAISTLLRRAAEEGWQGLEFLTGIPGSVGGAVRMNGGTHLGETAGAVVAVEAFDLKAGAYRRVEGSGLRFEYRKNLFLRPEEVVVSAEWRVGRAEPAQVKKLIDETLVRRKATQPLDAPSCGSVFKNPKAHGLQAWQVIDRLGLRGCRVGQAQISEKHSNWIVNLGGARASEVQELIDRVKRRSQDELGIPMEEEVVRVGS